jgi:hypothetical protein
MNACVHVNEQQDVLNLNLPFESLKTHWMLDDDNAYYTTTYTNLADANEPHQLTIERTNQCIHTDTSQ